MAQAHIGFDTCGFRGRIGDLVYKRYGDKTVVTRVPRFKSWSKEQKKGRSRFSAASTYAARVQRDPALRASYALWTAKKDLTIRSAAISDLLTLPAVESVTVQPSFGFPGIDVSVQGTQRHKFVAVTVTIRERSGRVLEDGPARQVGPLIWSYEARQVQRGRGPVLIEGVGSDRLGREARLSVEVAL